MMRTPITIVVLVLTSASLATLASATPGDEDTVSFAREIRPILQESCIVCHDEDEASSGLILTSVAAMKQGGKRGSAVAPGSPEESLLLQFVKGLREPRMPEDAPLTDEQIALLERWIKQGAKDDSSKVGKSVP